MAVDNEKVKAEATMAVGNMISLVSAVFASPAEAVTNYVSGENQKSSYQLIGVQAAVVAVMSVLYRLVRNLVSSGTPYAFNSIINALLQNVVSVIAVMAVGAFLITVLAKQGGVDVSFSKAFSIASLQAIVITPAYLAYYVLAALNVSILTSLASIVYDGAQVLAIILTYYGFSVVIKDKKKLFYGIGIYFVALLFVSWLIMRIF